MRAMRAIMRKELRDAVRSRWLVGYAAAFAVVALALSQLQGGDIGSQGFNRTTAGLINLCILLVPLLSLVLGAASVAGERERGTLATLLSQPISAAELLIGKYVGLTIAVWSAIALGFGAAGFLVALFEPITDVQHYLLFVLLSGALASATLSIGLLISVIADSRVKALSGAVLAWFLLVLVYDLGAIGLALWISSSGRTLLAVALGNPVEATRLLAVLSVEPDLQILGPLGSYMVDRLGTATSAVLLLVSLAAWSVAPLGIAVRIFQSQDA